MYVEHWESFQHQAEELFRARPLHTRYVLKFRSSDGKLVLKVTDDVQCLKYATNQQADLKRMEALNNTFFRLMARGPDSTAADAEITAEAATHVVVPPTHQPQPSQPSPQQSRKPKRRG
mmetsp:Transcript_18720/g.56641  ORF Transcript_18720/g.56641 Transcript_18720/m.56641 type:complete len:119 (+) Transcript_18720:378-734(+)|eukprot:CAMPEP_0206146836 /NCGR_PEP_ID=MMETSP1473-20131121/31588_1 /ASSEMBLY_ACC=CAM_ASM_001109 /TAXON_ID=1461547 /ORGANISM="Stichococcus sp, Strain RCC1054" /LENGTH=118 /DNA_ID=CAMNT_0053543541 /DNA_START=287 /DNA_END=643 /DNA_ORIENTATION=+